MNFSEFQRAFDKDYRVDEDQQLCAFGMRATVNQLDIALAYFGLKATDMNVMNVGESNEIQSKRVMLLDSMLPVQRSYNGTFAASNRPDAPVFWRWLARAIPVALLDQVSVSYGDESKDIATVNFEIKLVMLIGELMEMGDDKEPIESAQLKRTEIDAKESILAYIGSKLYSLCLDEDECSLGPQVQVSRKRRRDKVVEGNLRRVSR